MKRVGLIDNLSHIVEFREERFHEASAAELMVATGGNTGNVAFVHGVRKILSNPLSRVGWGWDPAIVRERFDHLVVCCANQLGAHADLGGWSDRVELFGLPITLIGLGAQSENKQTFPKIPDGTRRFLSAVKDHATDGGSNIAVRGDFTHSFLESMSVDSSPYGCPSLLISKVRNLGVAILNRQASATVRKVVVAAGNPWHGESAGLERLLVEIVEEYDGEYVLQHPESMIQFAFGESDLISEKSMSRFLEVYGERFDSRGLLDWYRRKSSVFADAPTWMRFLKRADLVLGPRYHGVALGIQAGIPGTVVTIDSRTDELCEGTGIKAVALADAMTMSSAQLVDSCHWSQDDAVRFDANRKLRVHQYIDFLVRNGLSPSQHLQDLSLPA